MKRKRDTGTFEVHDYLERTEHLTMVQHGALNLLLRYYYLARTKGQELPADSRGLCRMVRAVAYDEIEAVEYVARVYFTIDDRGNLRHEVLDAQVSARKHESERTKAAAHSRWQNRGRKVPQGHAGAYPPAYASACPETPSDSAEKNGAVDASAYASASPDESTTRSSGRSCARPLGTVFAKNLDSNNTSGEGESAERGNTSFQKPELSTGSPAEQVTPQNEPGLESVPPEGDLFGQAALPELPKNGHVIATWLDYLKARGEKAFEPNDPVFAYANSINLPHEFVALAWAEFKDRHLASTKRYTDWRRAFRNAVRDNWFRFWWTNGEGRLVLTTQGELARRRYAQQQTSA